MSTIEHRAEPSSADIELLLAKVGLGEGGLRSLQRVLSLVLDLSSERPVELARSEQLLPALTRANAQLEDTLVELRAEVASLEAQLPHCQTRRAKQLLEAKIKDKRWTCHDIVVGSGCASCDGSLFVLPMQAIQRIAACPEAHAALKSSSLFRFLGDVVSRRGADAKPRRSAALQLLLSSTTAAELMGAGLCDPVVECLRSDLELELVTDTGVERTLSLQCLLRVGEGGGERATTELSVLGVKELAMRAVRAGLRPDNGLRADCGACVQPALALVQQLSSSLPRPPEQGALAINSAWRDWNGL